MRYRKLDAVGDYQLGGNAVFWIDAPEAVGQAVQTRLGLLTGEWFVDEADGTPWMTEILGHRRAGLDPDAAIKRRILTTPGVTSLVSYDSTLDPNTRALSVTCTINTAYGQTQIATTL